MTPTVAGLGGTFSPSALTLSDSARTATFTFTAAATARGTGTVAVTNSGGLRNPAGLSYNVVAGKAAAAYTLTLTATKPGSVGSASGTFQVTLTPPGGAVPTPVTVTLSDGGYGGHFAPATVTLSTAGPSGSFTYTPSTAAGVVIRCSNNGALADPAAFAFKPPINTSSTPTRTRSAPALLPRLPLSGPRPSGGRGFF